MKEPVCLKDDPPFLPTLMAYAMYDIIHSNRRETLLSTLLLASKVLPFKRSA